MAIRDRPPLDRGSCRTPEHSRLPPCEREPGWSDDLCCWPKGAAELRLGRPPVSAVVRDPPVECAPIVAPRSRAWKAFPRESAGPAPTLNGEVRADLHEPWLTACNRSYPLARARRGHGCLSGAQRRPGRRSGEDIGTGRERATTTARDRGNRAEDAEGLRHGGGPPARTERHWQHHPCSISNQTT